MEYFDNKPTLKGEIKKARASNYNFTRAINEFIDNSLDTDANMIIIDLKNHDNKPYSIKISDNSTKGIPENKLSKIFSWTYERDRMENEIGKFGTGFKSASVNIGNMIKVYTFDKINNKYLKCITNWITMSENNNWIPEQINITKEDYNSIDNHPFQTGTSFLIEQILHKRHPQFNMKCVYEIANTYKYILQNNKNIDIKIVLNKEEYNLRNCTNYHFDNCKFLKTEHIELYTLKDDDTMDITAVYVKNKIKYYVTQTKKYKNGNYAIIEKPFDSTKYTLLGSIEFRSCHDTNIDKMDDKFPFPKGTVDMIRYGRVVGENISNYIAPRGDGYANTIKHEISYANKDFDDYMGISFNKSNDGHIPDNNIKYVLHYHIRQHQSEIIKLIEKQEELHKEQEETKKKQEEELKKKQGEDVKKKQEEELKKKQGEDVKKKQEELKKKQGEDVKKKQEELKKKHNVDSDSCDSDSDDEDVFSIDKCVDNIIKDIKNIYNYNKLKIKITSDKEFIKLIALQLSNYSN